MTKSKIPKHVAIIPDGNRRWAKEHGVSDYEGHRQGYEAVFKITKKARELGIKTLTFWGFSTENWDRSKSEVRGLMHIFEQMIDRYLKDALKNQVRIIHIGRKDRLGDRLINKLKDAEKQTEHFTKYYLGAAIDYGGRDEVIRAIKKISNLKSQKNLKSQISNLNEENFGQFLDTKDFPNPDPDLIIRTSGEQRTSGLMIWQAAHSEYIFVKKYFPDFGGEDLEKCIKEFARRQRRFGK